MRSRWKTNFDFIIDEFDKSNIEDVRNPSAVIKQNLLGSRVGIYTGKKGFSILIRDYMIGKRIGYYGICKKTGDFHPAHVKKKRRRKKNNIGQKGKKINKKKRKK